MLSNNHEIHKKYFQIIKWIQSIDKIMLNISTMHIEFSAAPRFFRIS